MKDSAENEMRAHRLMEMVQLDLSSAAGILHNRTDCPTPKAAQDLVEYLGTALRNAKELARRVNVLNGADPRDRRYYLLAEDGDAE